MTTVLCYGDSNTWGWNPAGTGRFGPTERWPGVLRLELGEGYTVIEEGLNGRTTVWDDPIYPYRNGKHYLIPCLESHAPLDLAIIMLGTNDLKRRFGLSAFDIAEGAGILVGLARASGAGPGGAAPKVLLVAPPPVGRLSEYAEMFEGAEAKSRRFGACYRAVAAWSGCPVLDAAEVIASSDLDGIHFDVDGHQALGRAVAGRVRELLDQARPGSR
jgi:lysophospholipase L1-like esterase